MWKSSLGLFPGARGMATFSARGRLLLTDSKERMLSRLPEDRRIPQKPLSRHVLLQQLEEEEKVRRGGTLVPSNLRSGHIVRIAQHGVTLDSTDPDDHIEYEGMILAVRRRGLNSSFMVRANFHGDEIIQHFPWYTPWLKSLEILRRENVKMNRLYYMKGRRSFLPRGPEVFPKYKGRNRNKNK